MSLRFVRFHTGGPKYRTEAYAERCSTVVDKYRYNMGPLKPSGTLACLRFCRTKVGDLVFKEAAWREQRPRYSRRHHDLRLEP